MIRVVSPTLDGAAQSMADMVQVVTECYEKGYRVDGEVLLTMVATRQRLRSYAKRGWI